jgi:large subunit ribosomal protein L13
LEQSLNNHTVIFTLVGLDGHDWQLIITLSILPDSSKMGSAMSTFMAKKRTQREDKQEGVVPAKWWVLDATDQVVGRLAVQIANLLRGKHRPEYTPHVDTGDFEIVTNAAKVRFTGKKMQTQVYQAYSHYPGGLKEVTARELMQRHPERILLAAVRRMVPRNRLGRQQMSKLKIYAGPSHPHQAQQPQEFKIQG